MEPPPGAYKKATAMLDEAARARLRGPFISDVAPSSAPPGREGSDDDLVDLVDAFYNGYDQQQGTDGAAVAKGGAPRRRTEWKGKVGAILADAATDVAAGRIRAEAERVLLDAAPANAGGLGIRKRLVEHLRARGFNAGICRSSWEKSGSIPAPGAHEYVDVVTVGRSPSRYIVEVNIASEFDVARPSAEYRDLLHSLPPVFVARPDAFAQVAAAMCAAAAASIRGAGMHLAPWRRVRYVQAKWSARYERVGVTPVVVAAAGTTRREETLTPVVIATATARGAAAPVPPASVTAGPRPAKQEEGAAAPRAVAHALLPGRLKNCGMEMGRRELAMGREALGFGTN